MNYDLLTGQVEEYVNEYFGSNGKEQLLYHDISHTRAVVAAAKQIAGHYGLRDHDLFVVLAAAWFHDMGYCTSGTGIMHELKSAGLAEVYLKEKGVDASTIAAIENCVLATKMPQHPVSLAEKIVCDADLFHLGTSDFSMQNKQMRKEYEATRNIHISKEQWRKGTIALLQSHHYHTGYCQGLLDKKKQENLEKLLKKQNIATAADTNSEEVVVPAGSQEQPAGGETKEKKPEKPSKGIETMFRIAVTNHQRLSDMADKKANIMISVNSIIISVVIGLVMRKLESTHALIPPTLMLLTGCVTAVVFSILATRPKIPPGYFTQQQMDEKTANLLFFGNFYKMDYDHYYSGMQQLMSDGEFLYASLIRDIHSQGRVLGHKYKLLRVSYTVFMFTLISTIIAFSIAFFFV
jgi:predicted metal-dependent HD superfamily phosphohydrolase